MGYIKTVGGKNFRVKKNLNGSWDIWNLDDDLNLIIGCPPYSQGWMTKGAAMTFLETQLGDSV